MKNIHICIDYIYYIYIIVKGINSMVEFIDAYITALPDGLLTVLNSKIIFKDNSESEVISDFTYNGTCCYAVDTQVCILIIIITYNYML